MNQQKPYWGRFLLQGVGERNSLQEYQSYFYKRKERIAATSLLSGDRVPLYGNK